MSVADAIRLTRKAVSLVAGVVALGVLVAAVHPCRAEPAVTGDAAAPATCATTPTTLPAFKFMCDRRIASGSFLGAYLSKGDDAVGDCLRRCTANAMCKAFSLDNRDPAAGRICTLHGSAESFADATGWVAATQILPLQLHLDKSIGHISGNVVGNFLPFDAGPTSHPSTKATARMSPAPPPVVLTPDMKALQPVYFATDRTRVQGAPLEASFGGDRDQNITYGQAIVSIPKHHVIGNVERPKFRLLRFGVEPETDADHFRIKDIGWLERAAFVDQLKGGADSVLLFVHGYNVTFANAIFKAAQIAYDANFAGTVLAFSWPSAGALVRYDEDRESAEFAVDHLTEIFRLLSDEIGKKNVYIVAHSMGNQVLVAALVQSALSKANLTITELVMAAPDVDKDVFGTKVDEIRAVAKNITLYASAADKALLASGEKSFGTRLGYVGSKGPNVFAGIDVIDVTAVGDDMLGLDHGTFSSSRAVLDDLGHLIRSVTHLPPDLRTPTLKFMPDQAHVQYWLYPP